VFLGGDMLICILCGWLLSEQSSLEGSVSNMTEEKTNHFNSKICWLQGALWPVNLAGAHLLQSSPSLFSQEKQMAKTSSVLQMYQCGEANRTLSSALDIEKQEKGILLAGFSTFNT
jgi:hypothetical protein